jgi:hypothetical protein
MQLNGGTAVSYTTLNTATTYGNWTRLGTTHNLSAGINSVIFAQRIASQTVLDKILITTDGTYTPT